LIIAFNFAAAGPCSGLCHRIIPVLKRCPFLNAVSAKQTQSLNAAAQFAPILDNVIALIIRIDLLEFHRLVTDNTIHQIQERASVVVHRHGKLLRKTGARNLFVILA
jgi:hypothetical protein